MQQSGVITGLDVDAAASELSVTPTEVRDTLADFQTEGLVEEYAATMARGVTEGACRITGQGLRYLRGE
jgi:hypothetical protein